MKKIRIILSIFVFSLALVGCSSKEEIGTGEIDYQAIYELDGAKIKTYLRDETIYYLVDSEEISTSGNDELKNNKIKMSSIGEETTLEFKKGKVNFKTDYPYMKSGDYKNIGAYTKEEFYVDFYGEKEYLNSNINGIYVKDGLEINIYQIDEDSIRMLYYFEDGTYDLQIDKNEEGVYYLDFFEDTYKVDFTLDGMELELKTDDEIKLSGLFVKKSEIDIDFIINNYYPN